MDSHRDFFRKHRLLFAAWIIASVAFVSLPQWLDAILSLVERTSGGELTIPAWAFGITVPIGLGMGLLAVWTVRDKKTPDATLEISRSEGLVNTLTAMHRRLVELQKEKASRTRVSYRQFEKVLPTLADRMGTVKIADWPKFKKDVKRRIRRASPRRRPTYQGLKKHGWKKYRWERKRYQEQVEYAALSVASEVRGELFQSKEWTFDDGMAISDWLDGHHQGVKELRDNDPKWESLRRSISHHLTDAELRTLIRRHIDLSHMYNNMRLIFHYSEGYPKSTFASMLHEVLAGSPISPEKAEAALAEVLSGIEKRLAEMGKGRRRQSR